MGWLEPRFGLFKWPHYSDDDVHELHAAELSLFATLDFRKVERTHDPVELVDWPAELPDSHTKIGTTEGGGGATPPGQSCGAFGGSLRPQCEQHRGRIAILTAAATAAAALSHSAAELQTLLADSGADVKVVRDLGLPGQLLVTSSEADVSRVTAALRGNHNVAYFEADAQVAGQVVSNDPFFGNQVGLLNSEANGLTADADVDADEAWTITTGSSSVVVSVIDSGIDYTPHSRQQQHLGLTGNRCTTQSRRIIRPTSSLSPQPATAKAARAAASISMLRVCTSTTSVRHS